MISLDPLSLKALAPNKFYMPSPSPVHPSAHPAQVLHGLLHDSSEIISRLSWKRSPGTHFPPVEADARMHKNRSRMPMTGTYK